MRERRNLPSFFYGLRKICNRVSKLYFWNLHLNSMFRISAVFATLLCSLVLFAQSEPSPSGKIYHRIQKLNFLGTVLYVAAHPDDENTRLITYSANHLKARTGYLSLTRGDGGQNLIGPQLGPTLGLIRTQELLRARKIDGGQQFFTRANDFGFSKNPDETFE